MPSTVTVRWRSIHLLLAGAMIVGCVLISTVSVFASTNSPQKPPVVNNNEQVVGTIKVVGKCASIRYGGTLHLISPTGLPAAKLYVTEVKRPNASLYLLGTKRFGHADVFGQPSNWGWNCGNDPIHPPDDPGTYQVRLHFVRIGYTNWTPFTIGVFGK